MENKLTGTDKTYFKRIEDKISAKENETGKKLTIDEENLAKFEAMKELWIDAGKELIEESNEQDIY